MQLALRLLRPAMWGVWEQVLEMASRADGAARRWQRRGEGHCLLKAWVRPVEAAVRALEVNRTQTPIYPLGPQITIGLRLDELEHPGGEARIDSYLTVHVTSPALLTLPGCPH